MAKRKTHKFKRRVPLAAVALYNKLRTIQAQGLDYVNEPIGRKREFLRGRYQLCTMLGLIEPWQSFPVECDAPTSSDNPASYRGKCWRLGWEARCALEEASR